MRFPRVSTSRDRLRRAGWDVEASREGAIWVVRGTRGENVVDASGTCRAEVWWRASLQAREMDAVVPPDEREASYAVECWSCGRSLPGDTLNCPDCGRREADLADHYPWLAWGLLAGAISVLLAVLFLLAF